MRRILVPLDGTAFSEHALPLARLLARRAGSELVLVHTYRPPTTPVGTGAAPALGAQMLPDLAMTHALRRARQDYLDDVVARTHAAMDVPAPDRRAAADAPPGVRGALLDGDVAAAIHEAALDVEADLIVMASHGRGGLARLILGSTTEAVVREGGVPVLVVPAREHLRPDEPDAPPVSGLAASSPEEAPLPRHLLVALDGSAEAEGILPPGLALATLLGSAVTLATVRSRRAERVSTLLPTAVLDPERADVVVEGGAATEDEASYLDAVARRVATDECRVSTRVLDGDDVVERLLDGAAEIGADWLAMATHGRGFWRRLAEGSVAASALERVSVPVLLLRRERADA